MFNPFQFVNLDVVMQDSESGSFGGREGAG